MGGLRREIATLRRQLPYRCPACGGYQPKMVEERPDMPAPPLAIVGPCQTCGRRFVRRVVVEIPEMNECR